MRARDAILLMLALRGKSKKQLGEELGYKSTASIWDRLNGKNGIRLDFLVEAANLLECDIVIRDRTTGMSFILDGKELEEAMDKMYPGVKIRGAKK